MNLDIKTVKKEIRERIWRELEIRNIARPPRPVYNRIPNFQDAEKAADRLFKTSFWMKSSIVKINPDSPQRIIRYRALVDGKMVLMPTPRLKQGFIILDPRVIPFNKYSYASTIKGAFKYGRIVSIKQLPRVDLVITGCVAVDLKGNRVGKGGGYGELEYAILKELDLINDNTPVATTVHDIQIVDNIPREEYDLTVDIIATPTRLIKIEPRPVKPRGIYWNKLGDKIELNIIKEIYEILKEKRL